MQWVALQVHMSLYKNSYFLLQVSWKSGTTGHTIHIRYCKSCILHLIMGWNRKFVRPSHYHSTELSQGKYHLFVAVGIFARAAAALSNITDNKLMIFSCIALYHGDTFSITTWMYATWHTKYGIWTHSIFGTRPSDRNVHIQACVVRHQIIPAWGSSTETTIQKWIMALSFGLITHSWNLCRETRCSHNNFHVSRWLQDPSPQLL